MEGAVAARPRHRAPAVTVAAAVVLAAVALAVGLARSGSSPPTLQERVQAVAAGLRCPVCQNLSVADSPSELAQQMRAEIATRLRAGQSPDQIRQFFASRYGRWILLSPSGSGLGLVAWAAPAAALVVGGLVVASVLGRRRRAGSAVSPDDRPLTASERDRIRREVAGLEVPE